jgi:hypothetical protein
MNTTYLLIPQSEYTSLLSDLTTLQCRIATLASGVARFDLPQPNPPLPDLLRREANVQVNVGCQAYNHLQGCKDMDEGNKGMYRGDRDYDMHVPDNRRYQDYTIGSDFPLGQRCEYTSGWRKENQMFPTVRGPEKPGIFPSGSKWKDSLRSVEDGLRGPGGMGGMGNMGGMRDLYTSSPTMPRFSGGGANPNGEKMGGMGRSPPYKYTTTPPLASAEYPVMSRARGSWTPPVKGGPYNTPNVTRAAPVRDVPHGREGGTRRGGTRVRPARQAGTGNAEAEHGAQGGDVEQEDDSEGGSEDDDEADSSSGP